MTLQFSLGAAAPETVDTACVLVGVYEHGVLTSAAARVDSAAEGIIKRQVESGDITGKAGSTTLLFAPHGVGARRVLVIGLGAQKTFDAARYQKVSIEAARALGKLPVADAVSYLTEVDVPGRDSAWRVRIAALTADHAAYRYTATFKPRDKSKQVTLSSVSFAGGADAQAGLEQARALAAGIEFTRELANLPPNICNPAYIAEQAQTFANGQGDKVSCHVLDHVEMERLGFGSLLAVARGSANKPKLIVLEYKNGVDGDKPYAFVGKGVTFDSGGISLKPGPGMEEMKFDMGAAGQPGLRGARGGKHARCRCVPPQRRDHQPVGPDHRSAQHRRRRPTDSVRRADLHRADLPAAHHHRRRHANRRLRGRAGQARQRLDEQA
jgi:leucyl aminopeptidase